MPIIVLLFLSALLLVSCNRGLHVVMYKMVQTHEEEPQNDTSKVLKIIPLLQHDEPNGSFLAINHTDRQVRIDLERSQIVLNGDPVSYYNPVTITTTTGGASTRSYDKPPRDLSFLSLLLGFTSSTTSVAVTSETRIDEKFTYLPPGTSKLINGRFPFTKMLRIPDRKGQTLFGQGDSPFKLRYYISYQLDNDNTNYIKDLDFYVNEWTVLPIRERAYYKETYKRTDNTQWKGRFPIPKIGPYEVPTHAVFLPVYYSKKGEMVDKSMPLSTYRSE